VIQRRLPEPLRMKILLCRSGGQVCAGAIASTIGKTAVYLFGATSNAGLKSRGSYALQWKLVEELKREGVGVYDLNGVNPEKNPGTYKFKSDLAGKSGREVCFLGRFDSSGGAVSSLCVQGGDWLRAGLRSLKENVRTTRSVKPSPDPAR
jgi:peptidoglycan pentaglycine glycine transferase (the first glycine)